MVTRDALMAGVRDAATVVAARDAVMAGVRDAATVVAARDAVMAGVKDAATVVIAVKDEVMVAVAARDTVMAEIKDPLELRQKLIKDLAKAHQKMMAIEEAHLAHRVVLDQVSQKRRKDLNSRVIHLP